MGCSKTKTASIKVRSFARDTRGSATIEFVLWVPIVVSMFCLIVNVTVLYFSQNEVLRVIQDANRNLSVGRLSSESEAEAFVQERISEKLPNAVVDSTISDGTVTTIVSYPASDLVFFNMFKQITGLHLSASAGHLIEDLT
ncbi:hypothetical protein GQE99_01640 [Maritimibacter sp. DP07]|uniref:TadE-like domain-containing protein n=1 Tax=Maritimibacter harenae TaxID=2606218 RepID=A0A845LV14_9RHOB|nr:TadE/TadG family type IV pilus assembly protein [Maritimibacter harenae]MZR11720.1 hypothetical protein [Maritimibacter harenae]